MGYTAIGGPGSGDKPNYQKALEALSRAMAVHGESAPIVQEALAELVKCMRYSGPYARTRFQAVTRILDTFVGRPREAPPQRSGRSRAAIEQLVDGLREQDGDGGAK